MTSLGALRKASVGLLVGAFAVSACGGGTPTTAPSAGAATQGAPSTAATTPPASSGGLITLPPSSNAPASTEPGVDPSDELEIAAPYTFAPLDENLAATFIQAMESSLGQMADVFDVGVKSAVKDGSTTAWVIVMRFPELGIGEEQLLEGAASGAAGGSGVNVEKTKIGGKSVRIIEAQGSAITLTVSGSDLVMVIPLLGGKQEAVAVITAIIDAN